jgi:hypothetical protein
MVMLFAAKIKTNIKSTLLFIDKHLAKQNAPMRLCTSGRFVLWGNYYLCISINTFDDERISILQEG